MQTITDIRKFIADIESAAIPYLNEKDEDNNLLEKSVREDKALNHHFPHANALADN